MRRRTRPVEVKERFPSYCWDEARSILYQELEDGSEVIIFSSTEAPSDPAWRPSFSRWHRWDERYVANGRSPGVYALARFLDDEPPSGPADPLSEAVVYIGETCSRTLAIRWDEFDGSAFLERNGHSGGWEYGRRYVRAEPVTLVDPQAPSETEGSSVDENTQSDNRVRSGLYVAGFTVVARLPTAADEDAYRRGRQNAAAFIRYAERRLLWQYVLLRNACPRCNRK